MLRRTRVHLQVPRPVSNSVCSLEPGKERGLVSSRRVRFDGVAHADTYFAQSGIFEDPDCNFEESAASGGPTGQSVLRAGDWRVVRWVDPVHAGLEFAERHL